MTTNNAHTLQAQRLLYLTYGILPIVAGVDKYFGYIVHWMIYLNKALLVVIPLAPEHFMHVVGAIEIAAGLLVLIKPRLGGCVVAAWLLIIAINLVTIHHYDIAIRDIAMAIGAYALVLLSKDLGK